MSVAVYMPNKERRAWWIDHLSQLLPEHQVCDAEQVSDPHAPHYAVVWKPVPGMLAGFVNLRATISIGAGIDHLADDPDYPRHVPVIKTTGPQMVQRMCEYVALHVLRHHREQDRIAAAQAEARWEAPITPPASERRVGVMGMGHLGQAAAKTLHSLGFDVAGWSRRGQAPEGITAFGADTFDAFLARSEILVCLLPLTPQTESILCKANFAKLPRGAQIINAGRGAHLVEEDLLEALAEGQIKSATLDVFRTEPLPKDHPFWSHAQVTVTPHVASLVDPVSGGRVIADNIRLLDAGKTPPTQTQIDQGY